MKGIIALQKMGSVRAEWLAEADTLYASMQHEEADAPDTVSEPSRRRRTAAGWIAAAVCATVGIGVYLAILIIGGSSGHHQPVGTRPEITSAAAEDGTSENDGSFTAETETAPGTAPETAADTQPETAEDTGNGGGDETDSAAPPDTAADTAPEEQTAAPLPPESEAQRGVRGVLTSLRAGIDSAAYATQELYVIRPQDDGKESSTAQFWGRDTSASAVGDRFYSFTRTEQGYAASGTANEITLIGDTLYYAKAVGVNDRQSKYRNTLTAAQQDTLRATIDGKRLALPTFDFRAFSWIIDPAMGHTYVSVTVGSVSDALLDRLLTAAGYDPAAQEVTVSDLQCRLSFEVQNADDDPAAWDITDTAALHTTVRLTASCEGRDEQLIFDVQEYRMTDGTRHITEPKNALSGYSRERDGDTLCADVMKLLHPAEPYEERVMYVTAAALKIRATPDFGGDGNVLGYLKAGDAVTVTGETDTYYVILYDGYPAYVGKKYLSPEKS